MFLSIRSTAKWKLTMANKVDHCQLSRFLTQHGGGELVSVTKVVVRDGKKLTQTMRISAPVDFQTPSE